MSTRPEVTSPFSFYTVSTVPSTVWGPGTISGRAIMALGETTLKVIDRIIDREALAIQWRLGIIRRTAPGNFTSSMYDDLIELSRPDIYSDSLMAVAAEFLWRQLEEGYGAKIAVSVAQLPVSEAYLVLDQLLGSRENELLRNWTEIIRYHRYLRHWGPDPTLDFLANLVQIRSEMVSACCAAIERLYRNPSIAILFLRFPAHPMLRLHAENSLNIPSLCRTPLAKLQVAFLGDRMYRWNIWKALEAAGHSAETQLLTIAQVLLNAASTDECWNPDFFDAAVDLLDFLLHSRVLEHHRAAADHLIACLAVPNHHSWEPLRLALDFFKGSLKLMCNFGTAIAPKHPSLIPIVKLNHPVLCEFLCCEHPVPRDMMPHLPLRSVFEAIPEADEMGQ